MTNEQQRPTAPTIAPEPASNPSPAPQHHQGENKPSNDKPGQQQQK